MRRFGLSYCRAFHFYGGTIKNVAYFGGRKCFYDLRIISHGIR